MSNLITKFTDDIHEYLIAKLPDVPETERAEIVTFIGYKTAILLTDVINERDKQWTYNNKKG